MASVFIELPQSSGGSGTVTSVALTVPSFLSVSGSPITTSGTLAVTLATEAANTVFSGPTSGGAATPTFRALVTADLPAGVGTVTSVALTAPAEFSVAGSPITTSGTLAITKATQTANIIYAGPSSGGAAQPTFRALVAADLPNALLVAKTSNYTATSADFLAGQVILADTSGGVFNITLPSPAAILGSITIKDKTGSFNTNNLTIVRAAAEKIEGIAASKIMQTAWQAFKIVTDQTDWYIV